jgi:radical SAM protein with 4Fe4S-binding SPASM domain
VNTACDLNCKMCYIHDRSLELKLSIIKKMLRQIKNAGVRLEILGGEPLLRADICEIITCAKRTCHVPYITLYSSGVHADEGMARKLRIAGLDAGIITLISHKQEIHDEHTGVRGSFKRTVQGIRNLIAQGIPVYTFTSVHRENYRDYRAIHTFVKERLGGHPLFYQYVPQRRNDPLMISNDKWHEIKHWVLMEQNRSHMDFVRKFYMLSGNACSGGNFVLTVKADGSVQPCPFVDDMSFGNVYDRSLWDIYRKRYAAHTYKEFKSLPSACVPCTYSSVCGGSCRAGNKLLYGTYLHRDLRCRGPFRTPVAKQDICDYVPSFF